MRTTAFALVALAAGHRRGRVRPGAPGPPKVLVVNREEIKPGQMGPHAKVAASFAAVAAKANAPNYRIGLTPISGDDNAVLYLEAHPSFAALEAAQSTFDSAIASNAALKAEFDAVQRHGDMHSSQRTAIYRYRADLSYRPGKHGGRGAGPLHDDADDPDQARARRRLHRVHEGPGRGAREGQSGHAHRRLPGGERRGPEHVR